MKLLFSHPTGNQNSRNAALGLQNHEMLAQFYTTVGLFESSYLNKENGILNELSKRTYSDILKSKTTFHPFLEIGRLFSNKLHLRKLVEAEKGIFCIDAIYSDLDRYIAKNIQTYQPQGVFAYEDGALQSFKQAKAKGMQCIYDLPACHWRKVIEITLIEKERNPEWASTLDALSMSEEKKANKDEELKLADEIIVASNFCKTSLNLFPEKLSDVKVIPYGFPIANMNREFLYKNKILKILFVGKLSQQKGLSYMFEAIKPFKKFVELTIIGSKPSVVSPILEKNLKEHTYLGVLPHNKVLEIMQQHDVLLFPSIMDAFGMVITESMAQGTPVITTNQTAGPELITHNHDGWIVNAGESDGIKTILEQILTRPILEEYGKNALEKALSRNWQNYQDELCNYLKQKIKW